MARRLALWLLLAGKAAGLQQLACAASALAVDTGRFCGAGVPAGRTGCGHPPAPRTAVVPAAEQHRRAACARRAKKSAAPTIVAPLLTGARVPAAVLAVAGADEAAEDDVEAVGDAGEIGASEHAKTVTLFPDFPDQSACPALLALPVPSGHGRQSTRAVLCACADMAPGGRLVGPLTCCLRCAEFTQHSIVDVLCGFSNTGDKSFNVTSLKGSLHSAMEYMPIQNFSEMSPFAEIKEGEQGTLYYRFYPDPNLEPAEYKLTLTVDYIDADKEEFQTVYFNQTIEIIESESQQASRTFFGQMILLVLLAGIGFGASQFAKRFGGKKSKARTSAAPKAASGGDEWLQDTMLASKSGSGKKRA